MTPPDDTPDDITGAEQGDEGARVVTDMLPDDERRARVAAFARSLVQVPVFWCTDAKGWPDSATGAAAQYTSLPAALRAEHSTDAHFAAYSVPRIARRLNTGAVGHADLPDGIPLVAFVVDVDDPETHTANARDKGKRAAPESWRAPMRERVTTLRAEHPAFVAYETRGGFRLLATLTTPRIIRDAASVEAWRVFYARALAWLHRSYGITGDPACHDWTRLYRLPCVVRAKGEPPQRWPMHGDTPGRWEPLQGVDAAADLETLRTLARVEGPARDRWAAHARRVEKALSPAPRLPEHAAPSTGRDLVEVDAATVAAWRSGQNANTRTRTSITAGQGGGRAPMNDRARRTAWARSVLDAVTRDMLSVPEGSGRNAALYNAALRAFRAAMDSDLSADEVFATLQTADGGAHPDTDGTLESARKAAEQNGPATMPERERPAPREPQHRARRGPTADDDTAEHGDDDGADLDAGEGFDDDDDDEGPELQRERDGRAVIRLGPRARRTADRAVRALAAHPEVFQRGVIGLCRIVTAAEPPTTVSEKERARRPRAGDAIIEPLSHPHLTELFDDVAQFYTRAKKKGGGDDNDGWRKVHAPPQLVSQVIARKAYHTDPAPRVLRGLIEAPAMRPDGTVITAPGYDPATGLYLQWHGAPLEVSEHPTRDDARAAYQRVRTLLASFHYQGDEGARETMIAAVVAAMYTPMIRDAIGDASAPGFMWSATDVASGKSTVAKACGAVVLGRIPAATQYTNDDDEMAKRAASIASTGRPLWFLDNVRATVEGSTLEQVLTCDGAYEARMLGTNEPRRMNWTATVYMTANGASYSRDMARRVRHIAMRPHASKEERDAVRALAHYDLVGHVLAHRAEILSDLLTIGRAHYLAGQPAAPSNPRASDIPFDSFDAWERWCAWPIWWASGYSPAWADPPAEASRDTNTARAVAVAWWDAIGEKRVTTTRLVSTCNDPDAAKPGADPRRGDAVLELGAALAELAGAPSLARVNSRSLGERIAKRVSGRSWEHPHGRVTIERDGETAGSAAYRARLDAYDRAPAPMPRDPGVDPDDAGPWRHPDDDPPPTPQQPRGRGESADDTTRDAWSVS